MHGRPDEMQLQVGVAPLERSEPGLPAAIEWIRE
jgi:hypothetical protein